MMFDLWNFCEDLQSAVSWGEIWFSLNGGELIVTWRGAGQFRHRVWSGNFTLAELIEMGPAEAAVWTAGKIRDAAMAPR